MWIVYVVLAQVAILTWNTFSHPLAGFPGPLLARSSLIWRFMHSFRGRLHQELAKQHKKYGPVVRVSPNELSFAAPSSWSEIYSMPTKGRKLFRKGQFYTMFGVGFDAKCIGSEREPRKHRRIRGLLSPGFSAKALLEQEEIVRGVVEKFITKLGEGVDPTVRDMSVWYGLVAFDLIGEMAFGESFNSLDNEENHFWIKLITEHVFMITMADNLRRLPIIPTLAKVLVPAIKGIQKQHKAYTRQTIDKVNLDVPRKDFLTNIIPALLSGDISDEELLANSSTLIIGGGDSVVSVLAGTTFHLLRPASNHAYQKIRDEVRQRFAKKSDITYTTAKNLPYLQAVIREGLRIFPPGHGMPRVSPGAEVAGKWVPEGAEVYASPWPMSQDEAFFTRPQSFEPERWLDTDKSSEYNAHVPEASHPFQLGPHICLGQNFAMMEMTLILSRMLWEYDLELVDKDTYWPDECRSHLMWLKAPLLVRFHKIERA